MSPPSRLRFARNMSLPPEAITQTFAVVGGRTTGKTHAAVVLAEEMVRQSVPVVVIDPAGEWWALRRSANGEGLGLPITILGGDKGDLSFGPEQSGTIAEVVTRDQISVVLDLSHMRRIEQELFYAEFIEQLRLRNQKPLHVVVDDADGWAPQEPILTQCQTLQATEMLIRHGHARGIGVTLATQRSGLLNHRVLGLVEVLIALRTVSANDLQAVDAWASMRGNRSDATKVFESIRELPDGAAWVWSSEWLQQCKRVTIREKLTGDPWSFRDQDRVANPAGETTAQSRALPSSPRLARLHRRLGRVLVEAKDEQPEQLKRHIAKLERQLRDAQAETEVLEVSTITIEQLGLLERAASRLSDSTAAVQDTLFTIVATLRSALQGSSSGAFASILRRPGPKQPEPKVTSEVPTLPVPPSTPIVTDDPDGSIPATDPSSKDTQQHQPPSPSTPERSELLDGVSVAEPITPRNRDGTARGLALADGERQLLEAVAHHYPFRVTRLQLARLIHSRAGGRVFRTQYASLRGRGLIIEQDGMVEASALGLELVGGPPALVQSSEEALARWSLALNAVDLRILEELMSIRPFGTTLIGLGQSSGFSTTGTALRRALRRLVRAGLVESHDGQVRASDALFVQDVSATA